MTSLKVIIFIVCSGVIFTLAHACNQGFYGSNCQYKCHCYNSRCASNGDCQYQAGCEKGWMGPMCQYQDLGVFGVRSITTNPPHNGSLLVDGDHDTCINDVYEVTVEFFFRSRLTWLQLIGENLNNVRVSFKEYQNAALFAGTCKEPASIIGSGPMLNVICYSNTNVEVMKLEMDAPVKLCSLLINGGRNLALSGLATQSSTLPGDQGDRPAEASRAVDGNTNTSFLSNSCTHTNEINHETPWWNVQLRNTNQNVNRVVIYNRLDVGASVGFNCCPERLNGFTMEVFNFPGMQVYNYADQPPTTTFKGEIIYNLTTSDFVNAYRVNISAHNREAILTLCEVEVYGYDTCPRGQYGPECSKTCHCRSMDETCNEINGLCKSGCADGFSGMGCDIASNSVTTTSQPLTFTNGNVHQDYTCYFGYMDVHIPVSLTPNAKLWLRDRTCELYNNGSYNVINVPYSSCGTLIQEDGDYIVMTNEITVHTEFEPSLPVTFGDDYTIDLKCTIPKHQEVTGSFQSVTGEPVLVTGENKTQGYQLKEFETADYLKEITRYPIQIPINKEVYFEVSLNEEDRKNSSLGIFVDECKAMPSLDPNDPLNFVLLTNGCPKTQAVHVLDSPGPEVFRFSVHGFHFTGSDDHDGFVYIHCDVTACPRSTCVQGCSQTTGRRKRRSGVRSRGKLIIGPYIIINNVRH